MKRGILIALILVMAASLSLLAAGEFKLPEYEKFTLKNGLTVYLMEQHEVPMISLNMVLPAGSVKDGLQYGLASLTADALMFGTRSYTKQQIEESLEFIGARYGTGANLEYAEVALSFVKKDIDTVLPILKEIITEPLFNSDEFEKRKTRLIMQLTMSKEQPQRVVGTYFKSFLFADHPYGIPGQGSKETVADITLEDVKTFYTQNYSPKGSAIAVVGDFKTSDMKKAIKKLFKSWKGEVTTDPVPEAKLPRHVKNRVLLVNKDDASETQFRIGSFGVPRSNPDYVPVEVINTILGGRFTSWLMDELRTNAGLTYGAGSGFSRYKESGSFIISSYTQTAKTVECIDLALEVYDRLFNKSIEEKLLLSAKNYVKGQYPPKFETSGALAGLLTSMFNYGYDETFINTFQSKVDELTVEKTEEIIKKYFPRENLQFVLIGKASEIRDAVSKYGEVVEKEIKDTGF
ncbi:insulinase family protein [bacterium]|nr:insulinase family protein [bacterium]